MPSEKEILAKYGVKAPAPQSNGLVPLQESEVLSKYGVPAAAPAPEQSPQEVGGRGSVVPWALKQYDKYAASPIRAAVSSLQNPQTTLDLPAAGRAAFEQFGKELQPSTRSGKEQAAYAGFPTTTASEVAPWAFTDEPGFTLKAKKGGLLDVSPAGVVGLGNDIIEDPGMLIGAGKAALSPARGLIGAAKAAPAALERGAIGMAKRHLRPTPAYAAKLGDTAVDAAAREAIESGAIQFGKKSKDTAEELRDLIEEVGAVKGDIVRGSGAEINPVEVAQRLENEVIGPLRGTAENQGLVKALEQKRDAFLSEYAPEYIEGGRKPGTPTTITRSMKFKTPDKTVTSTPFEEGGPKVIGEKYIETPNVPEERWVTDDQGLTYQERTSPYPSGISGERVPVTSYSTPDPVTKNIPGTKKFVEKRLEGAPEIPSVSPSQLEAEKTAIYNSINFIADPKTRQSALKNFAKVLKETSEGAITDPGFIPSKQSYGSLKNALKMADRTSKLTAGGGLMPHITDVGGAMAAGAHLLSNPQSWPVILGAAMARLATKGRIASSGAVTLNELSKGLRAAPEIAKEIGIPLESLENILNSKGAEQALGAAIRAKMGTEREYERPQGLINAE